MGFKNTSCLSMSAILIIRIEVPIMNTTFLPRLCRSWIFLFQDLMSSDKKFADFILNPSIKRTEKQGNVEENIETKLLYELLLALWALREWSFITGRGVG